jgi:hypothetical protein
MYVGVFIVLGWRRLERTPGWGVSLCACGWPASDSLVTFPCRALMMPEKFHHILRVMNTNIQGDKKIMYALCAIKGVGRRYSNLCCKKAEIDMKKRAGELVSGPLGRTCHHDI